MRRLVRPWGTRVMGTAGPHAPAAAHAGDVGGMPAELSSTVQLDTTRAVACMYTGQLVLLNGADPVELTQHAPTPTRREYGDGTAGYCCFFTPQSTGASGRPLRGRQPHIT